MPLTCLFTLHCEIHLLRRSTVSSMRWMLLTKPYPHPAALWNVFEFDLVKDQELKAVNPMEVWDIHYLRQIDGSGFIDSLYQRKQ